jgi:hypothetical protein
MWRAAVATLARYHQLDYRQLGFARLEQTDRTPLQQQLAYWQDYLDWAMEGAGHAIGQQALAWFNYLDATFAEGLGMPRLAGLPSCKDTIRQWQQLAGFPVRDYDYYLVFAGMRYRLILSRIMLATGQEAEIQDNFACRLLQQTMNRTS